MWETSSLTQSCFQLQIWYLSSSLSQFLLLSLSMYIMNMRLLLLLMFVSPIQSQYAQSQSSMFISNVDLIRALTKCSMLCVQYFRFIAPHILKL